MVPQQRTPGDPSPEPTTAAVPIAAGSSDRGASAPPLIEVGGRIGPEPTRFGDWERNGRCIDF